MYLNKDFLALSCLIIFTLSIGYFFSNYMVIDANGESMEPTLKDEDYYLCKKNIDNISKGDIITYEKNKYNKTVNHRVIDVINNSEYQTKGDNNKYRDKYTVERSEVLCKATFFNGGIIKIN